MEVRTHTIQVAWKLGPLENYWCYGIRDTNVMQRGEGILDLQLFATRGKGCGWGLQQPDHFSSSYKALNHPNFPVCKSIYQILSLFKISWFIFCKILLFSLQNSRVFLKNPWNFLQNCKLVFLQLFPYFYSCWARKEAWFNNYRVT